MSCIVVSGLGCLDRCVCHLSCRLVFLGKVPRVAETVFLIIQKQRTVFFQCIIILCSLELIPPLIHWYLLNPDLPPTIPLRLHPPPKHLLLFPPKHHLHFIPLTHPNPTFQLPHHLIFLFQIFPIVSLQFGDHLVGLFEEMGLLLADIMELF